MIFLSKSNLKLLLSTNSKVYKFTEFDFVNLSVSEINGLCFSFIIALLYSIIKFLIFFSLNLDKECMWKSGTGRSVAKSCFIDEAKNYNTNFETFQTSFQKKFSEMRKIIGY